MCKGLKGSLEPGADGLSIGTRELPDWFHWSFRLPLDLETCRPFGWGSVAPFIAQFLGMVPCRRLIEVGIERGGRTILIDRFADTAVGNVLAEVARCCRMVFFTGLPASGKSFLLREQISMAVAAGRRVKVIRWDAGLAAFEKDGILAKYPDVEDGSHPVIRKAAGRWGRQAVARWVAEHPDPAEMLIGEVPIIGNRYSEFVQTHLDEAEPAMTSGTTVFIYPIPTRDVRRKLEAIRRDDLCQPATPR